MYLGTALLYSQIVCWPAKSMLNKSISIFTQKIDFSKKYVTLLKNGLTFT